MLLQVYIYLGALRSSIGIRSGSTIELRVPLTAPVRAPSRDLFKGSSKRSFKSSESLYREARHPDLEEEKTSEVDQHNEVSGMCLLRNIC